MPQALAFIAPTIFGVAGSTALIAAGGGLTLAGVVAAVGGSLVMGAVARALQPGQPDVTPEALKVATAQDAAARIVHYGRVRVGYAVAFISARQGVLSQVVVHGQGPFDAVEQYLIDSREVSIDGAGWVLGDQYAGGSGSLVQIVTRAGNAPQAVLDELTAEFAAWGADHRLDGLACSLMRAELPPASEWTRVYPDREPRLEVVARASLLRDPRDGVARWSENAALCALAFEESADGGALAGLIDVASFAAAADICDEVVALAGGGSEPRYRFSGSWSLDEQPAEVRNRLLGAQAGQYWITPDGLLGLRAGAYAPPRFTITDAMVLAVEWQAGLSAVDGYNVQRFEYVDPALRFARVAGDPVEDADSVAVYGERSIAPFISTPSHRQARAVCAIAQMRENPAQEFRITCKPEALLALYEETVALDLQLIGLAGVWRVRSFSVDPVGLAVTYDLALEDAAAYAQSLDDQGRVPALIDLDSGGAVPVPALFNAAPQGVQIAGGSYAAGIGVAWAAAPYASLAPLLEYAAAGSGVWQPVALEASAVAAQITGLESGAAYDVRLRWQTPGEAVGPQVQELDVIAQASTGTPAVPSSLQAVQGSSGVALVSWVSSASAGLWKTEVFRGGVLVAAVSSEASTPQNVSDLCGAGSFEWTVRAVSVAGAASALSSGVSVTIS